MFHSFYTVVFLSIFTAVMKGPKSFNVENDFCFTKEDCYEYNLPTFFISLKASSWLEEEILAEKIVSLNSCVIQDAETGLSVITQGFTKLQNIDELPDSLTDFAKHVLTHYKRPAVKKRFQHHFETTFDHYSVQNSKIQATNSLLKESYRIHTSLGTVTADEIIGCGTSYHSDDSQKSEDYHPQRSRNYTVDKICEDPGSPQDSILMSQLREFRHRSVELSKIDVNQISDLRLLSLDFIYLFSEEIDKSVTKYLGTEGHLSHVPEFACDRPKDIDPVTFNWCMKLANFRFNDNNNKWMELQKTTIAMLNEAITNYDKPVVQVANLLHTVSVPIFPSTSGHCHTDTQAFFNFNCRAPRLLINPNESKVEDTHIHNFVSYIIKLVFGIEDILKHEWANGRLHSEKTGKFKPDYVAYVRTRSTRHDLTIAEVKPTESSSRKPPSDLVKLGQQMKLMLNNLVSYKIPNPVVCGILVEGKKCSLYKMDIVGPAFYRMVHVVSFSLCTNKSEVSLIPNMFMWMSCLKDITIETAKQIEQTEIARAKGKGKRKLDDFIPESWVRRGSCAYKYSKTIQ
ncbi:uncharacterized protein EV154DRAFT_450611 [Mucor mucedo]|uniref:uncharacterized protein n=1 Tax=Mucor mucedo TaxID=29922 RepID=UPI00221EB982|nr:uncharacterized protein EV154DRAFT_450611 [Mucor mucedo]KAI7880801.1 hypothetical protein EV154DRAFT_450611 [Mucor mucedo]